MPNTPDHDGPGCSLSATPTGLEPATSAVTGRRANQLRYGARCGALVCSLRSGGTLTHPRLRKPIAMFCERIRTPNGIRTRATAVKGRRPRPLDDGGLSPCGNRHIIGPGRRGLQNPSTAHFRPDRGLRYGFRAWAGSSVGTSVRLKSGRSAVRPRPCPQALQVTGLRMRPRRFSGGGVAGQGATGGTNSKVIPSSHSSRSTTGRWMTNWRNVKPTRSRARRPSTASSGSMKNGFTRFGSASAAL